MKWLILKFLCVIFSLFALWSTSYACTIKEIVQMSRKDAGSDAIVEKCKGSKVSGAPRCSLVEVIGLAEDDLAEFEIKDRCKRCSIPMCVTAQTECVITQAYSKIKEGGQCSCPTPWGWQPGEAECRD